MSVWKEDGTKTKVHRCIEQDAPAANTDVDEEICSACPIRAKLVTGERYKPPTAPPPGPTKKDTIKTAGFVPCDLRIIVESPTCCGGIMEVRVCDNHECQYFKGVVDQNTCANCPVRKS